MATSTAETAYIALLRGVNLAGHKPVAMADLVRMATSLGFADARTILQSGNLVFRAARAATEVVEARLETEAAERLGLATDFFVRTAGEWAEVVAANPFHDEAARDPSHLVVVVLKSATSPARVKALQSAIAGREIVRAKGRHAYITYPDGIGRSRLTAAVIDRHFGTRGTARNWNTVRKLAALVVT